MFQICTSAAPRKAASALTVLAAIGASGMVSECQAAPIPPSQAVRVQNSSYADLNWVNWLTDGPEWYGLDAGKRAWITWNVDLGTMDPISYAGFAIDKNGEDPASSYSLPAGGHLQLALVTDPWSPAVIPDRDGPDVETSSAISVLVPPGLHFEADITSLMQIWQAAPGTYYGIRFYSPDSPGGVRSPGDSLTGHLVVPEPTSLGIIAVGSMLALRRRRD